MFESYLGRTIDPTKPVRVYRNLNKKGVVYSIQQAGKVVGYSTSITLSGCTCVVKEKQRQQVVSQRVRQVHAWIEGMVSETHVREDLRISYNPYKFSHFYNIINNEPVTHATHMLFNQTGVIVTI